MAKPANNEMILIFCFEKVDKRFGLFFSRYNLSSKKIKSHLDYLTSMTYLAFAYLGFPLTKGFPFT